MAANSRMVIPIYAVNAADVITSNLPQAERHKVENILSEQSAASRAERRDGQKARLNDLIADLEERVAFAANIDLERARR